MMTSPAASPPAEPGPSSLATRWIATVLAFAVLHVLASLMVPFLLAMVVAIALAPVASRLERAGLGRAGSSVACTLLVLLALLGVAGLIAYQVGSIGRDADRYVGKLADAAARVAHAVGADRLIEESGAARDPRGYFQGLVRRNAEALGRWLATGIGGAVGILGGLVIFLAFLCYLLQGRGDWIERLRRAGKALGMRPRDREFSEVAGQVGTYLGYLGMVSAAYVVLITGALWLIGVPQPLLWGVLTGVLELIPFFGPVVAGALPTLAALGSGDAAWQPLAVVGLYVTLQTVEGYVVAPLLYGKAVDIDPVTVLLGVLFFGFLLGPAGLALAMPLMILLRGAIVITPGTPALDALADAPEPPGR